MKPGLKRIEATLDQLGSQNGNAESVGNEGAAPRNLSNSGERASYPSSKVHMVEPFPLPTGETELQQTAQASLTTVPVPHSERSSAPQATPHAFKEGVSSPTPEVWPNLSLPRSKTPSFSSHRHAANPNLAIGMLQEIETLVRGWQQELSQIVQQIQAIYQEGPIVDGWLESCSTGGLPPSQSIDISMLRHAEIEHLMTFIEQLCNGDPNPIPPDFQRTSYRLCGLDSDGQIWSRPCPPEQVPYVGLAIARYQKLRTLLAKKQTLENRLMGLVEMLTVLHAQIQE
ncbi:MAG: hypothetical protein Kow00121_20120 [Elainellaceae cyanobacterium]